LPVISEPIFVIYDLIRCEKHPEPLSHPPPKTAWIESDFSPHSSLKIHLKKNKKKEKNLDERKKNQKKKM